MINEDFLHFVWKFQAFNFTDLRTTKGEQVCVLKPGIHNKNSGPDFKFAHVQIDGVLWVGHVEIHINASDWYRHKHHLDDNYDAVILHVVYNANQKVYRLSGKEIPTLVLCGLIFEKYLFEYDSLFHSMESVPCSKSLKTIELSFMKTYYEALMIERLEMKNIKINTMFVNSNKDYKECFYQLFAYALGLKINAAQLQDLAVRSPLALLAKHRDDRLAVESILYGQSGLLNRCFSDEYPRKLKSEYLYFKEKYKLHSINYKQWNFFRLRPSSFPTVRISMLADFCVKSDSLFHELLQFSSLHTIKEYLNLKVSSYWRNHYVFDKKANTRNVRLGKTTIDLIIINAVLPFCFFYATQKSNYQMMQSVIDSFRQMKSENNKILRFYKQCGVKVYSALESQALIHLHQNYCIKRKCLNCRVFNQILK